MQPSNAAFEAFIACSETSAWLPVLIAGAVAALGAGALATGGDAGVELVEAG